MKKTKHVVTYEIKDARKELITKTKTFDNVSSACSFFNEIKSLSVTVPIMDTIQ